LVPRTLAYLIDLFAKGGLTVVLVLMFQRPSAGISGGWIVYLILFAVTWFYYTAFEILWGGYTLGKRALGLRVVMEDGAPVTPGASMTRNLLRFADEFMGLTLIGILAVLFSPGFRRLGDWAAGTMVVHVQDSAVTAAGGETPWLTGRVPAISERPLTASEKRGILDFCRRYPRLGEERAREIAAHLVPSLTGDPKAREYPADYLLCLGVSLVGSGAEGRETRA